MRQAGPLLLAVLCTLSGAGCAGTDPSDRWVSPVVVIHNHHLDPSILVIPANRRVTLRFAAFESSPERHMVSFPELGIGPIDIPGSTRDPISVKPISIAADLRTKSIDMPPLASGTYRYVCDCHGAPITGYLRAE